MSGSMLPEWKQLLLERKRREEKEREKREREEEERLASLPAWKRGIIQRRREKQEGGGVKKREKAIEAGRELETETVEPVWKNFSCSQNGFAKEKQRKELEKGNNEGKRQRESRNEWISGQEKERYNEREDNSGKWRDREIEQERKREREIIKGMNKRESDDERGRKIGKRDDDCVHLISGIHSIKVENIIIIKKRKKVEKDGQRDTEEGKNLDLKRILPGGENVTEICVSDLLIIKPSMKEERSKKDRKQGDENEKKLTLGEEMKRECRNVSQLISKFGENCKLPCRSKSSDCFIHKEMGGEVIKEERNKRERKEECRTEGSENMFRRVPERSFSFSEQVSKERNDSKDMISGETEMEEIQKDGKDREQKENGREFQHESQKVVKGGQTMTPISQSMVKFLDEIESQSNREERGMIWNDAEHHRGEILIPRSVFYGIGEQSFSKNDRDEIRWVERRLSWKAGRSLTRVESLKQRIWQKERGETEGGDERARKAEMQSRQEVASPQSVSQFDVTREVSKEELPVCVPPSLSAEQVPSVLIERHDGLIQTPEREKERDEDLLGEDYIPPSQSSTSSSSPSPPLGHTHPAMSRIYNLKPVSSRTGVCITERNLSVQTHSEGMIRIRPGGQFAASPLKIQTESSLQSVQREVEQLHLKEQEVQKKNDEKASQKQNVCETCQPQNLDTEKKQTHTILKPYSEPRVQTQHQQISTSITKSINTQTVPSVSSSATPLFTIRSASRGTGKRGVTFTITPRKSGSSGTPPSSVTAPKVSSSSSTTSKEPSNLPELSNKRYPTAEEIEVIGGYQKLERSCLLKNRGSPKLVRFDDSGPSVCTYPPEVTVVEGDGSSDDWRSTEEKQEEKDEECSLDEIIGTGRGLNRVLRVDESCKR
ncbi:phostensin [Tachysurus vachellii]|uniref:phostensin n=1 Tax=Tachysurus vachellii TaxID=175792 RepID=UPI00296B0840|nr:phostensin [Tachysurus vachellii]